MDNNLQSILLPIPEIQFELIKEDENEEDNIFASPSKIILEITDASHLGSETKRSSSRARKSSFDMRRADLKKSQKDFKRTVEGIEELRMKWKKLKDEVAISMTIQNNNSDTKMIDARLDEIKSMCTHNIRSEYFFATLPVAQQMYIRKLTNIQREDFTKDRRANWQPRDYFIYAIRMSIRVARLALQHKKYLEAEYQVNKTLDEAKELHLRSSINDKSKESTIYSVVLSLRLILTKEPEFRTDNDISKILWYLRSVGAFTHLIPMEMAQECARFVGYERYDDGRVISYQGKVPNKVYFVLAGKLNKMKHYKLMIGEVTRCIGSFSTKEMTENTNFPQEYMLVANGTVEVLTLYSQLFLELYSGFSTAPIEFLKNISIFRDFPCELFIEHPEEISFKFFPSETIISQDSRKDPFIHIVKTGSVKVCRHQMLWEVTSPRESMKISSSRGNTLIDKAEALCSLPYRQRSWKRLHNNVPGILLPPISSSRTTSSHENKSSDESLPPHLKYHLTKVHRMDYNTQTENKQVANQLIRERSNLSAILVGPEQQKKPERMTYIQLGVLEKADVFGFQDFHQNMDFGKIVESRKTFQSKEALLLISNGAEVIQISKKFFVQHCKLDAILRIETLRKVYVSEEEAKESVKDLDVWKFYRTTLMRSVTELRVNPQRLANNVG